MPETTYFKVIHYIFSDSIKFESKANSVHIEPKSIGRINQIKASSETDIYLCGGGEFAGWLFDNGLIDQVKLKLNPIILGEGIRLFGKSTKKAMWKLTKSESFDSGLMILTFDIKK